MLSDWYTMLYNPSPDYITTLHCTQEAVFPLWVLFSDDTFYMRAFPSWFWGLMPCALLFCRYTIVLIYYAFCLVFMMLLRPLLVKKIACGLGKTDRFKSIYAALYFFPILTVLQAVGGGLLCESYWRSIHWLHAFKRMHLIVFCLYQITHSPTLFWSCLWSPWRFTCLLLRSR